MRKRIYGLVLLYTSSTWLQAEVIHDQSFGATLALDGPDYQIDAAQGFTTANNLFYSFDKFNLANGESATFNAPSQIEQIISRVTGGASDINGTIRSISNANLYFFNPAGIVFGASASLDIPAAFYASTADSLGFSDGKSLSLTDLNANQWSSAPPSYFGFSQNTSLSLNQAQITSTAEQNIHLSAGTISANAAVLASGGDIELHAVDAETHLDLTSEPAAAQQATIQLENTQINSLNGLGNIRLSAATVQLQNSQLTAINSTPVLGGDIQITAKDLSLNQASIEQLVSAQGDVGDIKLNIGNQLNIQNNSNILNRSNSIGAAGNIQIQANNIDLGNNSYISGSSFSSGAGGNIQIDAQDLTIQDASSFIASQSRSTASQNAGDAGTINLNISNIQLQDGASLVSSTKGAGNAGEIFINSQNLRLVGEGDNGLASRIQLTSEGAGSAGKVIIKTNNLSLENGTFIATDTATQGAGGVIDIQAQTVNLRGQSSTGFGSFIVANADGTASGGQINVISDTLTLSDGAQIATASFGRGDGGNIDIQAKDSLNLSGKDSNGYQSGLFASSLGGDSSLAKGGTIKLQTSTLTLTDNAAINTETTSQGSGGEVVVQAGQIKMASNAQIQASSVGLGNAGTISLQVGDSIVLQQAKINTSTDKADGGSITVNTPSYLLLDQSEITTSVAAETGNGGNIALNPEFLLLDHARIVAQAVAGDGGHIDIQTSALYEFSNSLISASSEFGLDGIIAINTPDEDVSEGLVTLITQFNQSKLSHSVCQSTDKGQQASQMLVLQYLGSPLASDDWQPSHSHYLAQLNAKVAPDAVTIGKHHALFRLVCANPVLATHHS